MKDGIYTIDSIEKGIVKLLYRNDESIEVFRKEEEFPHEIYQGLILEIEEVEGNIISTPLHEESNRRREYARELLERLKGK